LAAPSLKIGAFLGPEKMPGPTIAIRTAKDFEMMKSGDRAILRCEWIIDYLTSRLKTVSSLAKGECFGFRLLSQRSVLAQLFCSKNFVRAA